MFRYEAHQSMMLSGVFNRRSRGRVTMGPMIMMKTQDAAVRVMQVPMALASSSFCLAPKYWATIMLAPAEMPMNKTRSKFSTGPALPTAARALSPT